MTDYLKFTYPRFQPAQALKSGDLNNIVAYLEQQERLTRVYLIGSGVLCGLNLSIADSADGNKILGISSGAAVSSQGYLFALRGNSATTTAFAYYYKPTDLKISQFRALGSNDTSSDFPGDIYELLLEKGNIDGAAPVTATQLENRFFVLLWSEPVVDRKSCINSCDGPGGDVVPSIRVLALNQTQLDLIWQPDKPGGPGQTSLTDFPFVKRLNTQKSLVTMEQPEDLYQSWSEIISGAIEEANDKALPAILIKATGDSDESTLATRLQGLMSNLQGPYFQYVYDYLLDLVATYEELALLKSTTSTVWCPDESAFPRFVVLGSPADGSLRMGFYQVQKPGTDNSGQGKIDFLRNRLIWLLEQGRTTFPSLAELDSKTAVRISASGQKSSPLSNQAIPYYYGLKKPGQFEIDDGARNIWNFEFQNSGRSSAIQGYEKTDLDGNGNLQPGVSPRQSLCYNLGGADFFRIEGHINQDLRFGFESIENLRKALNLPFDITCVRLGENHTTIISGDDQNDPELAIIKEQLVFGTFAKWHPGMEHHAGVPKGGTFILVYSEDETLSAQKIRSRRDKLLDPKFTLLENMDKANNEKNADLIKSITLELNTLIRRTIIADFCLPYTCCPKVPTVHYQFTETLAPPTFQPDADFDELKRTYDELAISKNPVPRIKISFENRSDHADKFVWTISPVDMNPGAKFPYLDPIDNIGEGPLELEFNLNIIRKIAVKLVASKVGSADFDTANKEIDLCPNEAAVYFTDNKGQGNETKLIWTEGEDEKEIFIGISPPGGERVLKVPVNINIKENEKISSSLFRYLLVRSKELAEPVEVTIEYNYPCIGLLSTIKFTVPPPPPPPQKPDNTPKPGDTPPDVPANDVPEDPRIARYRDNIEKIADAKLKTTTAYKRTAAYIAQEAQPDWQKALNEYTSIARAVLGGVGKPGGATDDQFKTLYQNLIWRWLDKTVEANPALPVPDLLDETLTELNTTLRNHHIDTEALLSDWQADDIKTNGNTALLNQIQQLLTASPPEA